MRNKPSFVIFNRKLCTSLHYINTVYVLWRLVTSHSYYVLSILLQLQQICSLKQLIIYRLAITSIICGSYIQFMQQNNVLIKIRFRNEECLQLFLFSLFDPRVLQYKCLLSSKVCHSTIIISQCRLSTSIITISIRYSCLGNHVCPKGMYYLYIKTVHIYTLKSPCYSLRM